MKTFKIFLSVFSLSLFVISCHKNDLYPTSSAENASILGIWNISHINFFEYSNNVLSLQENTPYNTGEYTLNFKTNGYMVLNYFGSIDSSVYVKSGNFLILDGDTLNILSLTHNNCTLNQIDNIYTYGINIKDSTNVYLVR